MLTNLLILLCGLALVVTGADILVDGASAVARRFGLSEFVIGLTIVGMGTSAPEMVVSFIGAIEGNADVSIGNVVGSNIFNTLLILGVTALLMPVGITPDNRKKDIPINIGVTALLIGLGLFGGLSAWDGGLLLAVFVLYMWQSFSQKAPMDPATGQTAEKKLWLSVGMIIAGIGALIWGGTLFVDNATALARGLGVSDKFIAVTLLAGGTSLPELATCVAAAVKKKGQLALGNIIGSNLFNILLILGGSALIHPLSFQDITFVDLGILLASSVALLSACIVGRKNTVDRLDGALFVLLFAAYFTYLFIKL